MFSRSERAKPFQQQHRYRQSGLRLAAIFVLISLMLTLSGAPASYAAPNAVNWPMIHLEPFANSLSSPIDVESAFDGTGRLFVLEQAGVIRIFDHGTRLAEPFLDISSKTSCCGELGLLGLAFPPDFADSGYFFVNYTSNVNLVAGETGDNDGVNDTVIARYHLANNPNRADAASEERIFVINQPADNHNGGHILFGPDQYLYIGMGDGGGGGDTFQNGQDTHSLLGKILRIQVGATGTYTVPATNPFVNNQAYRPEIWATGLRNPWRYGFDRATGDLYIADVGQGAIEEVNYIAAANLGNGGMNFGWPVMEGDACYPPSGDQDCDRSGLTPPVATYHHDPDGCSITGGYVFNSKILFQAPVYLYGDYCSGNVWGLQADDDKMVSLKLKDFSLTISSFGEDEEGNIYIVNYDNGEISRISEPSNAVHLPGLNKEQ